MKTQTQEKNILQIGLPSTIETDEPNQWQSLTANYYYLPSGKLEIISNLPCKRNNMYNLQDHLYDILPDLNLSAFIYTDFSAFPLSILVIFQEQEV